MSTKAYFSEKLNNLMFLEIRKEKLKKLFNVTIEENVYLPIKTDRIVDKIKSNNVEDIPVSFFIEGMFLVLGVDEKFKYNSYYVELLKHIPGSLSCVKGKIAEEIKSDNFDYAYILLKGILNIEENQDIYEKLLSLAEQIRSKNKDFKDEELTVIEAAIRYGGFPMPYLYLSILNKDQGDFSQAIHNLNMFLSGGGEKNSEIIEYNNSLKQMNDYEKGKELLYENPKEALKLFLKLVDELEENPSLFYYIAIAYRLLKNYEKAIYYLNEVLAIDTDMVQAANELGINYASIGDYNKAIGYMRKAFEVTKSIEICTNLVMCYINSGELEQAKNHLELAKKIDSDDEIVRDLQQILEKK